MANTNFAIELPTNRQSRWYHGPAPNVHDPNYIPVLNGAHLKVDFSQPSFSALPSIPTPYTSESQTSLKRTKSAYAPETVVHKHVAHPVPARTATTSPATPQEIGSSHQPDRLDDARSPRISSSDASTTGPINVLEEHVFMIPGNSAPKVEEILFPTMPPSARLSMSMSSTRKTSVPTSRHSKKTPSVPSLPPKAVHKAHSSGALQHDSPKLVQPQSFESTPVPSGSVDLSSIVASVSTPLPRLQVRASTASERRARALHSHPSNVSLKSRRNSTVEETDELPLMSHAFGPASRSSSTRSRTKSICNSTQPTPAPDAPLPDLPIGAKRPPTRERLPENPLPTSSATPQSSSPGKAQNDHMEMAEFMASNKTTVFRRFDEIHVRLLLQLQDEISALERALKKIEDAGSSSPEHGVNKASIMRDLRKLLAEYDHLFANWSSMQANKATPEAKRDLEKWLQSPGLESGKVSKTAMDDLQWLQNSKDLSSVSIDPEKQPHRVKTSGSLSKSSMVGGPTAMPTATDGGDGGFLALFGCASKRK